MYIDAPNKQKSTPASGGSTGGNIPVGRISFSFENGRSKKVLALRHGPTNIQWNYNVNTNIVDTYTGQVVQVLSVNIDQLVIEGQLGVEGPFGRKQVTKRAEKDRSGDLISRGSLRERTQSEQFSYSGKYVGLHGMLEFFREYFAVVSQGADAEITGHYQQIPMTVEYDVRTEPSARHWPQIIPTSFPSFRRSNENFAPEWRIEAMVIEADKTVRREAHQAAIARLRQGIGYKVANPFSDPLLNNADVLEYQENLITGFRRILPNFNMAELQELIWNGVTVPRYEGTASASLLQTSDEFIQGEVGATKNSKQEKRDKRNKLGKVK